jgi:hypothetical protein
VKDGGAEGIRTPDPHNAIVVLYQLSYDPNPERPEVKTAPRFVKSFARGPTCGFYHATATESLLPKRFL